MNVHDVYSHIEQCINSCTTLRQFAIYQKYLYKDKYINSILPRYLKYLVRRQQMQKFRELQRLVAQKIVIINRRYMIKKHKHNLMLLAKELETVPQIEFDMGNFRSRIDESIGLNLNNCGSVGCAIGIAAYMPRFKKYRDETLEYSFNELAIIMWESFTIATFGLDEDDPIWCFLFSSEWESIDNTPIGASKRIKYLLSDKFKEDPLFTGAEYIPRIEDVEVYKDF